MAISIRLSISEPKDLEVKTLSIGPLATDRFVAVFAPDFSMSFPPVEVSELKRFAQRLWSACEEIENARATEGVQP